MAETIQKMVEDIQATVEGISVIKSVQRGEATGTGVSDITNITIAKVNAKKCLVILEAPLLGEDNYEITNARLKSLTDTNLEVYTSRRSSSNRPFSYQVIEFN